MNPYTTFSSQPRIIEAKIGNIYFKTEKQGVNRLLFKIPQDGCPFVNSVYAKNALIHMKESEIKEFEIDFKEKKCIDEGNVLKSFTDERRGLYRAKDNYTQCSVEVPREVIEAFISKFLDYEKPDYPETILHLVMRWNDELREKNGAAALSFELKCTKMEF